MNLHSALPERTFTVATDDSLSELIFNARDRILYVAPGITEPVAIALVSKLADSRLTITVIIDNDPEVYRLGYGTPEGLAMLKTQLDKHQFGLRCQPGIRIGVLVVDDKTIIYAPAPQLIEAGSSSTSKPNALFFEDSISNILLDSAGASENTLQSDGEIGTQALTPKDVDAIKKNVDENPPEPFDLTQKARVFSSRLQYVEFKVEEYRLTTHTVAIPAYLMGLAGDMQNQWRNSLKIMTMESTAVKLKIDVGQGKMEEISVNQKYLDSERKKIEDKFLIPIQGFGSVMFKNKQKEFETEVADFDTLLILYFETLSEQLSKQLDGLVKSVVNRLLPSVIANPPEKYKRHGMPTESDISELLERDIMDAVSIKTLLKKHRIKKIYKDIAYQSVKSNEFGQQLHKALTKADVLPSIMSDIFRESNAALGKNGCSFNL